MAEFYSTPRLAKMTNSDRTTIEEDFKGEDLKGNFDVQISLMNGFPANKLAKQQFIFQSVDKMIVSPEKAAQYLEFGEADEALRQSTQELEVVQKGIKKMKEGNIVKVHTWDNNEVWAKELMLTMREEFDDWTPQVQQIFEDKLAVHREALALAEAPANQMTGRPASVIDPTKRGFTALQGLQARRPVSGAQPNEAPDQTRQQGQEGTRELITRSSAGAPQNV